MIDLFSNLLNLNLKNLKYLTIMVVKRWVRAWQEITMTWYIAKLAGITMMNDHNVAASQETGYGLSKCHEHPLYRLLQIDGKFITDWGFQCSICIPELFSSYCTIFVMIDDVSFFPFFFVEHCEKGKVYRSSKKIP